MATTAVRPRQAGELLREWRERRRMSQFDLASGAGVSTRHLSFVENGRSRPSQDLLLRLAERLEVPLRDRNHLLLAAGHAPVYPEHDLGAPAMAAVRATVRQVLAGHDPNPAAAVDRHWNLVDANAGLGLLIAAVAPHLLAPPVNVLRASLHPDGLAPRIANLGEWRAHLLGRLRRQLDATGDPVLAELLAELRGYPCDQPGPAVELPGPGDVAVPLRLRPAGDGPALAFISTVSVFGTPLDVTVAELVIEAFFPADEATAAALRAGPVRAPRG